MLRPVRGSNESGKPFSPETILRDQACPHWGRSPAGAAQARSRATVLTVNITIEETWWESDFISRAAFSKPEERPTDKETFTGETGPRHKGSYNDGMFGQGRPWA